MLRNALYQLAEAVWGLAGSVRDLQTQVAAVPTKFDAEVHLGQDVWLAIYFLTALFLINLLLRRR